MLITLALFTQYDILYIFVNKKANENIFYSNTAARSTKNHSKSVHYLKFPFFLYFLKLADKVLPYIL